MSRLLTADIGGTHARFAVSDDDAPTERVVLATRDFRAADDCVDAALAAFDTGRLDAACVAVAGPVQDGVAQMADGALVFRERQLADRLHCPVRLVNDFVAVSRALPALRDLRQVGEVPAAPVAPRVCLGPGTGLGAGALLPVGDGWLPVASEAAHAGVAPGSPLEQELLNVLQARFDFVCWETVLSGPGLVNLYGAVSAVWGAPADALSAQEITGLGVAADNPVCHQTLEVFCALLGAFAGSVALTFCARGGVYIAGGIVPSLADFVVSSPLRRRFDEQGDLTDYARAIPIHLVLDEDPGLTGARQIAREIHSGQQE